MILDWFPIRNASVCFDFYSPVWIEEGGDHDHGGGGPNQAEELAVNATGGLPVFRASEVHTSAIDMLDGAAALFKSCLDDGEALVRLCGDVAFIAADRAGAGDVDVIADAYSPGESDDRLEG